MNEFVLSSILRSFADDTRILKAIHSYLVVPELQADSFLKPFFKGKHFAVEWERGKFDFDHYFAILTNFLKRQHFLLSGIWFGSSKGSFSKKKLSKTDLPFKFCKIGLKNTLFIFGRKNGRLLFVCLFVCLLLQFLSDFGLLFLKIEALIELRKMLLRKKLYHVRFGNCSTPKVPRFCRFTKFTKMQLALLLDGRAVLDKLFFQNEV